MKRTTSTLAAAALLFAACGTADDPAQPYRDALPTASAVKIGTPGAEGTTDRSASRRAPWATRPRSSPSTPS